MSNNPVIDMAVFAELKQNMGDDFIVELIDTYLGDAPKVIDEMKRALMANDVETFRRAAHSLKSNSANFGAMTLSAQAKELEMQARAGTLDGAAERLAQVENSYSQVKATLEKLRQ